MGGLRLSVALCTYDGERFLEEQLESIARQVRPPDELVVSDDGSVDGTPSIVRSFAAASAFPVRFGVNGTRLGSTKNFEQAVSRCEGDVVVLSDQDDVWLPEKLREIEAALLSAPSAGAVFSDAEIVGEGLEPLGYRLWDAVGFGRSERRSLARGNAVDVMLRRNVVTGATLAFRARYRALVLPIPADWVHDAWIALLIAAVSGLVPIDKPLVKYRQHAGSQIGALRKTFADRVEEARRIGPDTFAREAVRFEAALERLAGSDGAGLRPGAVAKLSGKIRHARARAEMPRNPVRRSRAVFRELVSARYHRYSFGFHSAAKDLFF